MTEESANAHDLARIASLACDKLIRHFEQMPDQEFSREFDGLEGADLFNDIPTGLEWMKQRFYGIDFKI